MDDDLVAQFTGITAADTERAQQYLQLTDGNLEHAVQLYFDNGGADMGASASAAQPSVSQHMPTAATRGYTENDDGTVTIDDDGDDLDEGTGVSGARAQDSSVGGMTYEDDEAMARRLQEEAYGAGGGGRPEDVRAPMARTTETLVGPGGYDDGGADDMRAAIAGQMFARQQRRREWASACSAHDQADTRDRDRTSRHIQPGTGTISVGRQQRRPRSQETSAG